MEDPGHDPNVGLGFARRIGCLPMPLQPASRIDQRTVLFGEAGRRQLEDFSLDARGVGRVLRTEVFPEPGSFCIQRVDYDEEFQFAQRLSDLPSVRERLQRIEALADVAVHLAIRHHLKGADDIIHGDVKLRQPIVRPVIVSSRGIAINRLLEADDKLPIILPVTRLAGTQRLELSRLHIIFEGGFAVAWEREITGDLV